VTALEFRDARRHLGLSQAQMADWLGLKSGDRAIRRWERGDVPVSGPAIVAVRYALKHGLSAPT